MSVYSIIINSTGTHSIRSTLVSRPESNSLNFRAQYVMNSDSRGVLIILFHISSCFGLDLNRSVYRMVERVESSSEDTFRSISMGTYRVLTYDIDRNGLIDSGMLRPATSEIFTISGVGMYLVLKNKLHSRVTF